MSATVKTPLSLWSNRLRISCAVAAGGGVFPQKCTVQAIKTVWLLPQVAPDLLPQASHEKDVKAVGAHPLTDPPVGEMGHGSYWPRLHGRGYFSGEAKTNGQSATISRSTSRPFICCRLKFPGSRSVLFTQAMRRRTWLKWISIL